MVSLIIHLKIKKSFIEHSFVSFNSLIILYNKLFFFFNKSDKNVKLVLISHSHDTFFEFIS